MNNAYHLRIPKAGSFVKFPSVLNQVCVISIVLVQSTLQHSEVKSAMKTKA